MNSTQLLSPKDLQTDANDMDALSGVQAHDRRSLEKLYLTYYASLARFLSRIVAQTSAVDEIINDAFMTIWNCAKEFRGESRVAVWILGIVYRTTRQAMELQRFPGLPLEECVTLALTYQMGFSIDEIAEITDVAPATVKIRMLQARTGLLRRPSGDFMPIRG